MAFRAMYKAGGISRAFWPRLLNTFMHTTTPKDQNQNANLDIDAKLIEDLKRLHIIDGAAHFSRACGKNPTYFACMRKRGYGLHIGSLAFLLVRLSQKHAQTAENDVRTRARLRSAMSAINEAIQEKCKLRELELFG